jgi:hypothetical protein
MALTEADLSRFMAQGYRRRPTPSTPSVGIPSIASTPSVPTATQAWHAPMTIRESSSPASVLGPVKPLDPDGVGGLEGIQPDRHWTTGSFGPKKDKTTASYVGSYSPADIFSHHYEGVTDKAGNKVGFDQFVKDAKAAKHGAGAIFRRNNPQFDVFPSNDADYYSKAPMYAYGNKGFDAAEKVNPIAAKALRDRSGIGRTLAFAAPRHVGIYTGGMGGGAQLNEKGQLVFNPATRRTVEHEYGHIAHQGPSGEQIKMREQAQGQYGAAGKEYYKERARLNAQADALNASSRFRGTPAQGKTWAAQRNVKEAAHKAQQAGLDARHGDIEGYGDYLNEWNAKNKAGAYPKPYGYNLATGDTNTSDLHYNKPQEMDQLLSEAKREFISTSGKYKHDGPFDAKDSMDAMNWFLENSKSNAGKSALPWLKKPENQKAWESLKPMMYQRMQEVVQADNPAWGAEGAYA